MDDKIELTEEAVKAYLDKAIRQWRKSDEYYAIYYVDAFQSVRTSLFGLLLPKEEKEDKEKRNDNRP